MAANAVAISGKTLTAKALAPCTDYPPTQGHPLPILSIRVVSISEDCRSRSSSKP